MRIFQHTAEDIIYLRTDGGVYFDTLENFKQDYPKYQGLPSGYIASYYDSEQKFFTYTLQNGTDEIQAFPEKSFETILNHYKSITNSQEKRNNIPPTLDEVKATTKLNVNIERHRHFKKGFTYEGNVYQIDSDSLNNIHSIMDTINSGMYKGNVTYRDSNNVNHEFTQDEFKMFSAALHSYRQAVYKKSWDLKDKILSVGSEPSWKKDTSIAKEDIIQNGGWLYIADKGGKTGSKKPKFPTKSREQVTDNNVVWRALHPLEDEVKSITW